MHEKILDIISFRIAKKKKKINKAWRQEVLARMWLIWSPHPGKYKIKQSCWKVVPHEPAIPPLDIYPSKTKTYFLTKPV